jgi:hypothetical protein
MQMTNIEMVSCPLTPALHLSPLIGLTVAKQNGYTVQGDLDKALITAKNCHRYFLRGKNSQKPRIQRFKPQNFHALPILVGSRAFHAILTPAERK